MLAIKLVLLRPPTNLSGSIRANANFENITTIEVSAKV